MTEYHWIEDAVSQLLRRARIKEPPIDLEKIAVHQGAKIVYEPTGSLWGSVSPTKKGLLIRVNSEAPLKRRFTLAHEIAHTLLSKKLSGKRAFFHSHEENHPIERLCDKIASEILMPTEMVRPFLSVKDLSLASIQELSKTFETSLESAAIKFGQLISERSSVEILCWRLIEDTLVIKWGYGTRIFRSWGSPERLSRSLGGDSAVSRAFRGDGIVIDLEPPIQTMKFHKFLFECKGYGTGNARYVLSLTFRSKSKPPATPDPEVAK